MSSIYIIDEVWPLAGEVTAYRDTYMQEYAPGARRRGMMLEAVRLSPPTILAEGGNKIMFIWSIPDVPAFWALRFVDDEEKLAWWAESKSLVQRHERSYHRNFAGETDAGQTIAR